MAKESTTKSSEFRSKKVTIKSAIYLWKDSAEKWLQRDSTVGLPVLKS